jgi:hypothetical protein
MDKPATTPPTTSGARNSFREIEWASPDLVCPECGTCSISVHLRCDIWDRYCAIVANCGNCEGKFDAKELLTYSERFEQLRALARTKMCAHCEEVAFGVQSFCDKNERVCFFLLTCKSCGAVELQ